MKHTQTNIADVGADAALPRLVKLTRKRGMSEATFAEMITRLRRRRDGKLATAESPDLYAETVAESVFGGEGMGVPDCLRCGACCAYFHQIAVLDRDATPRRLTVAVWEAGDIAGPKTRWLRREPHQGNCVAFVGSVSEHAGCAIYELRPHSCRAFEAGSDRCRAVRRVYGLEPPLSESERSDHAKRLEADAGDDAIKQAEALASRAAASFGGQEKLSLLSEMIAYNHSRLEEILREAERLQALLAERRAATAARASRIVSAISEEAHAAASAIAKGPVIGERESLDGAAIEKLNRDLLEVAAHSQAALERAVRWLMALGEVVFATFEMRVEPT